MMFRYIVTWGCIVVLLVLVSPVLAERPGLRALNADIIFHVSFDQETLDADLAVGEAEPLSVAGEPRFDEGVFGKALVLGGTDGVQVQYATFGNFDLSVPGALSFWIAPQRWHGRSEVDERPYMRMLNYRGVGPGHFFIQRQGFRYVTREDGTLSRRHDRFQIGFYNLADWSNVIHSSAFSQDWKAKDWRLVVINWDRAGYAVSYNGEAPSRREFPRLLESEDFAPDAEIGRSDRFTLGYRSADETTLIDELTVYRRPLEANEIKALYEDRLR